MYDKSYVHTLQKRNISYVKQLANHSSATEQEIDEE